MSWSEIQLALNGTALTPTRKTLDEIISDSALDTVYELANISTVEGVVVHPKYTSVADGEYEGENIHKVVLPRTVEIIGENAFCDTDLTDVVLPSSVKEIKAGAFSTNPALETVIFKGKPNVISETAFGNTPSLTHIYVPWREGEVSGAPWSAGNGRATVHYNWR